MTTRLPRGLGLLNPGVVYPSTLLCVSLWYSNTFFQTRSNCLSTGSAEHANSVRTTVLRSRTARALKVDVTLGRMSERINVGFPSMVPTSGLCASMIVLHLFILLFIWKSDLVPIPVVSFHFCLLGYS